MNAMQFGISLLLKLTGGIVTLAAIAYLAVCIFLLMRQNRLMFFPTAAIETTPTSYNLPYEDVWIPVRLIPSVERMHGWWLPAKGTARGVVLHLHGNGYNISANLGQAYEFHQLGLSVLLVDYRGYGRSEGPFPTETQFYQDAEAAWSYLTQTRRIPPDQILIYGHSLGGAIAINLAVNHPEAAGLIVQSSFASMGAMSLQRGFWMFPVDLLLTQRFDSLQKVRSLKLPVLYVHGTVDSVVPAQMSETLFAATPEPKYLHWVPGADHNDVAEVGGTTYLQVLEQFIEHVQPQTAPTTPE